MPPTEEQQELEQQELLLLSKKTLEQCVDQYEVRHHLDDTGVFLRARFHDFVRGKEFDKATELAQTVSKKDDPDLRKLVDVLAQENEDIFNSRLANYLPTDPDDKTKDHLSLFFQQLASGGKGRLAYSVPRMTDIQLRETLKSLEDGLLTPFRTTGGKTPVSSFQSPLLGMEESVAEIASQSIEPATRARQGLLRSHCLKRDGFRCVVTRLWSRTDDRPVGARFADLEAAHIIPFALGIFKKGTPGEDENRRIWANINRCFPELQLRLRFDARGLNSENNIIMLWANIHKEFGEFRLIFEATEIEHRYRLTTFGELSTPVWDYLPPEMLITFESHDPTWPLPEPALLRVHAAIGRYLYLSGHGERVERILREQGKHDVLASDGSTDIASLLSITRLSLTDVNLQQPHVQEPSAKGRAPETTISFPLKQRLRKTRSVSPTKQEVRKTRSLSPPKQYSRKTRSLSPPKQQASETRGSSPVKHRVDTENRQPEGW